MNILAVVHFIMGASAASKMPCRPVEEPVPAWLPITFYTVSTITLLIITYVVIESWNDFRMTDAAERIWHRIRRRNRAGRAPEEGSAP